MVDQSGHRFINESTDYMSFGQEILRREADGDRVGQMWLIFDQSYRDSYIFAGQCYPRMALPESWYKAGVAQKSSSIGQLADKINVPAQVLEQTLQAFNEGAGTGVDDQFGRGESAYDRYYGDPTQHPNPNLRALDGKAYYAVKIVLSDLGTCGGVMTNAHGRALDTAGEAIERLYGQGNTAANIFGNVYPGAGATIGQSLGLRHHHRKPCRAEGQRTGRQRLALLASGSECAVSFARSALAGGAPLVLASIVVALNVQP